MYPHLLTSTNTRFNIYTETVFRCVKKYFATIHAVQTAMLVQELEKSCSTQKNVAG